MKIPALYWAIIEKVSVQVTQFSLGLLLARLLTPEDFGLFAILGIFLALSNSFVNSGFGQAIIQSKSISYNEETAVFTFNIVVSFAFSLMLICSAKYIAKFYGKDELEAMIRVMSLTIILNALSLVPRSKLTKQLRFDVSFRVNSLGVLLGASTSVVLAFKGYAFWSLVVGSIVKELSVTILYYYHLKWRPNFNFAFRSIHSLYTYGSRLFLVSISNSVFFNLHTIVIGKLYPANFLGFYSRGESLSKFPVTFYNSILSQFTFPLFSKHQNDKDQLQVYFGGAFVLTSFILFPILTGLFVTAEEIILVLLTEKWIAALPYLKILSLVGVFSSMSVINLNVINALGKSGDSLRADLISKLILVVSLLVTYRLGLRAMALGYLVATIFSYGIYAYIQNKYLGFGLMSQVRLCFKGLLSAILIGGVVSIILYYLGEGVSPIFRLLLAGLVGLVLYVVLVQVLFLNELRASVNLFTRVV